MTEEGVCEFHTSRDFFITHNRASFSPVQWHDLHIPVISSIRLEMFYSIQLPLGAETVSDCTP